MICIVFGTRPEIIKMSPIVREVARRRMDFCLIHTNQHFSESMDAVFFRDLNLPLPDYNLHLRSRRHGSMVGELLTKIEKVFLDRKPNVLLVQGDTNSSLAGAIAAWKMGIKIGHVEAGLRSYDRNMPEEMNRKVIDHISDLLFCPTDLQKKILLSESIPRSSVYVTGNTIVDAVLQNIGLIKRGLDLVGEKYLLLTLHRPSNVDNKTVFRRIVKALRLLSSVTKLPIVFPIHPRTKKMARLFKIEFEESVFRVLPPVGYLDMLCLEKNASLILTDSGGIQEEACVLGVPCVTIRDNTERPETVNVGANIVAGTETRVIVKSAMHMIKRRKVWANPFGDGSSAKKIVDILAINNLT